MNKLTNLHASAALLEAETPDILMLSELWNSKDSITLHHNYASLISKPDKYEGVAIFYKRELELRPFKEHLWTNNYIFGKMNKTIVVSVYLNPRNSAEQFETLKWMMYQFMEEGFEILAAGDFNLDENHLRQNTEKFNISRNIGATRKGPNANKAIDHFLSTYQLSAINHLNSESDSDHIPISTEITV